MLSVSGQETRWLIRNIKIICVVAASETTPMLFIFHPNHQTYNQTIAMLVLNHRSIPDMVALEKKNSRSVYVNLMSNSLSTSRYNLVDLS